MSVHEGGVTLGQNCCQATAKSGIFDSAAAPGTVLIMTGISFGTILILATPEMIVKQDELLSFSHDLFVGQENG